MKRISLTIIFLLLASIRVFASGGMANFDTESRVDFIKSLRSADNVEVYTDWSIGEREDPPSSEIPVMIITGSDVINTIVDSISLSNSPAAECGYDYTLVFFRDDKEVMGSPIFISLECNNIRFYWENDCFGCGINNIEELREILPGP